jgi:hypothetical protein
MISLSLSLSAFPHPNQQGFDAHNGLFSAYGELGSRDNGRMLSEKSFSRAMVKKKSWGHFCWNGAGSRSVYIHTGGLFLFHTWY